jgi:hypothetical protein
VVGASAGVSVAPAQTIRGTARVADTKQGSAQTTIALVDSLGDIVAGSTTGASGVYMLRAPHAGTYRVRARRIGFTPDSSRAIVVASDATVVFDPVMTRLTTQLAAVRVQETRRCVLAPQAGAEALRLWQEAQNALSGAAVNTVSGGSSFVLNRFQRQLDSQGKRVIRSTRWQLPAHGSETYASISADSLATQGFVKMIGSDAIYYAPDARTLLSDSFAQTHCLRPVAGATGSDSVGLAFEPVGSDHRTEVAGTLWLARSTGKLMYLEFRYVDAAAGDGGSDQKAPHATGRVDYRELPGGAWIISSWVIRAPLVRVTAARNVTTAFGSFRTESVPSVTGWWEFGGDVADVTTSHSDTALGTGAVNSGSLRGTLVDSGAHTGVSDVWASVETADSQKVVARSITDAAGRFAFATLPAGDYVLGFAAARLDTIGVTIPPEPFAIVPGKDLTITTIVPESDVVRACPAQRPGERVLHGELRDSASGAPLASVPVRATWLARASTRTGTLAWQSSGAAVVTDTLGRYIVCGLPPQGLVTTTITGGGGRPTTIVIPANTDAVILRNVTLAVAGSDFGLVSGVARASDGSGIIGVEISSLDDPTTRTFTDSVGAFKLLHVPSGFHILRLRRLGFAPSLVQVRVSRRGVATVNAVMSSTASVLNTVNVKAPSGEVVSLPREVARRLSAGQGYYILSGDARLRDSHNTSDVFRRLQGVTIKGGVAVSTRGINSLLADPCPLGMPLYVNGAPMGNNILDVVAPSEIAAIEVYPTTASMPPSMPASPCGAIMIWTK